MCKKKTAILTTLLLASLAGQLVADQPSDRESLVATTREMAAENVGLKAILDYQTGLLAFGEADPEQARTNRQTREQCTALVNIGNLCDFLVGTFAGPDGE